jgi:hypothetical protein
MGVRVGEDGGGDGASWTTAAVDGSDRDGMAADGWSDKFCGALSCWASSCRTLSCGSFENRGKADGNVAVMMVGWMGCFG